MHFYKKLNQTRPIYQSNNAHHLAPNTTHISNSKAIPPIATLAPALKECSHALLHVEAGEVLRSCKSVVAFQCVRPVFVPPRKVEQEWAV